MECHNSFLAGFKAIAQKVELYYTELDLWKDFVIEIIQIRIDIEYDKV
jgi:hypothetical protein